MGQYLPLLTMLVLALVFAALSLVVSGLLAPRRPTIAKSLPYESGIVPRHEPVQRFPVRFYVVAMLFIIFDIEIIFLYPWAVASGALGTFGLVAMIVFAAVVFISLLYEIAMGGLEWGPVKRLRPPSTIEIPTGRTTSGTIRRVASGASPAGEPPVPAAATTADHRSDH